MEIEEYFFWKKHGKLAQLWILAPKIFHDSHMCHFYVICTLPIQGWFWLTCRCPNQAQDGLLEIPSSLISEYASCFQNEADWTPQNFILPRLLCARCPGQNRGRNVIFSYFFPFSPVKNANQGWKSGFMEWSFP